MKSPEEILYFYKCGNYRGVLKAKKEDAKFYWQVDCDIGSASWSEITEELWKALKKYHNDTIELSMLTSDDDNEGS